MSNDVIYHFARVGANIQICGSEFVRLNATEATYRTCLFDCVCSDKMVSRSRIAHLRSAVERGAVQRSVRRVPPDALLGRRELGRPLGHGAGRSPLDISDCPAVVGLTKALLCYSFPC